MGVKLFKIRGAMGVMGGSGGYCGESLGFTAQKYSPKRFTIRVNFKGRKRFKIRVVMRGNRGSFQILPPKNYPQKRCKIRGGGG